MQRHFGIFVTWFQILRSENILHSKNVGYPVNDKCTAILVGRSATIDGSTMTTHTADCAECDWRINKVPARDWPEGSQRPIYLLTGAYPRQVREDRGATWSVDNLENIPEHRASWEKMKGPIIGYIPQVAHTYALIEGLYGIMNQHQVAIGESTCAAKLWAAPIGDDGGGKALLEASELSQIALERSKTAVEAIQIMGDLAVKYGFYSSDWHIGPFGDGPLLGQGGEALTVVDPEEAWMFHILPDDSGASAVWVAQKVPDDHVAVVANQFVIREVDPLSPDFMFSDNLWMVAQRNGWWDGKDGYSRLDFKLTYAPGRYHPYYSHRRVWRAFSLLSPGIQLPAVTDAMATDYPFSIPVSASARIAPKDLMRVQRDHYEGTVYDLTKGIAAGPFGDPNRFDIAGNGNMTQREAMEGEFSRAISLFRTSYSIVAQARRHVPDLLSLVWLCQYAPDSSTYAPLYVATDLLPPAFTSGTMHKYDSDVAWWNFCVVGNYAARMYSYAMAPVRAVQRDLETMLISASAKLEADVMGIIEADRKYKNMESEGGTEGLNKASGELSESVKATCVEMLTVFTVSQGEGISAAWRELFPKIVAGYRDGYALDTSTATVGIKRVFYPQWWLKAVGYFNSLPHKSPNAILFSAGPDDPTSTKSIETIESTSASVTASDSAIASAYFNTATYTNTMQWNSATSYCYWASIVLTSCLSIAATVFVMNHRFEVLSHRAKLYNRIIDI